MGAYLPKPITKKVSSDHAGQNVVCGASSMQGWRIYQEDAHNVIVDFDENKSLFAVYDGHGGSEVAVYASQHLPDFIKNTEEFKNGNYKEALIKAFMDFDKSLLQEEVLSILKSLKKDTEGDESYAGTDEDVVEDYEEDSIHHLCEEATMPLSEVISRYRNSSVQKLKESGEGPMSPMLKSKDKKSSEECGSSSAGSSNGGPSGSGCSSRTSSKAASSSSSCASAKDDSKSKSEDSEAASTEEKKDEETSSSSNKVSNDVSSSNETKEEVKENVEPVSTSAKPDAEDVISSSEAPVKENSIKKEEPITNGDPEPDSSSTTKSIKENGERKSPRKSVKELGTKSLLENTLEDDSSESDEDFEADINSSDDSDEDVSLSRVPDDGTSDEESAEEEEEEEDEEDDDEEDSDSDEEMSDADQQRMRAALEHKDVPGMDSGCTAVVVLIVDNKALIANAGDSRAVLSRSGKAEDLSEDHKPEDEAEKNRIVKAGGEVSCCGRVNGGLNLSRALGDHSYKQNSSVEPAEQMITAFPDIKEVEIVPGQDEFIVLACDGIWNSLSSQEVVDFVAEQLKKDELKLSEICEQLFDKCLAPDTLGDGTGCDNMTCVIVKLNTSGSAAEIGSAKRIRDENQDTPNEEEKPAKKIKTTEEENVTSSDKTDSTVSAEEAK